MPGRIRPIRKWGCVALVVLCAAGGLIGQLYYGPDAWGVAISSLSFLGFVFLVVLGLIQGRADDALRKKREERLKEIFQSGSDAELPTVDTEPLGLYLRPGRQCYLAISSVQVGAQQIAEIASTSENSIGVQKILTIGAKETTSHKATREEFVYGQNGTLFILDDSLVFVTASRGPPYKLQQ